MPETKLSFSVLHDHLRKCWIYYIIGIIAIIFLNNLVFAVTRPVIPEEETVRIMLLNTAEEQDPLDACASALMEELTAQNHPLRLLEFENMVTTDDEYFDMLLIIKLTEGYSDLFITDETGYNALADKGAYYPLDGIIAADDPRALCFMDEESGITHVAGLRMVPADKDLFPREDLILVVSSATTNPEDALTVMDMLIDGGFEKK